MSWNDFARLTGLSVVFGLLLLALWPGERQGTKLLKRWGVAEPEEAEITIAVTYLRRRRLWYPWLYFLFSALGSTLVPGKSDQTLAIVLCTLLIGALLAEVLALRRPRGDRREASLSTRRITDLVPHWHWHWTWSRCPWPWRRRSAGWPV